MPFRVSHYLRNIVWLTLVLVLGAGLRLYFLWNNNFAIDADEAIVGLMAKHIGEGYPWPVFYYGQDYMGSLEALLVSLSFDWFGYSNFSLKLVPLFFSLLNIVAVFYLAQRYAGGFGARVASLLTAVCPSTLVLWSTKARGGFIELVFIGTVALILAHDLLEQKQPKYSRFFLLSAVLGLAWWINNQAVFYIAAITIVFIVHFLWNFGLRKSLGWFAVSVLGFVLGGAPYWYTNVLGEPLFRSVRWLFSSTGSSAFSDNIHGFYFNALPILLGARRFWSEIDLYAGAVQVSFFLYGLALLTLCLSLCFGNKTRTETSDRLPSRTTLSLLVSFLLLLPVIFSFSKFGWLASAPRYLLSVYSVIFVVVGIFVSKVRHSRIPGAAVLAYLLVVSFLAVNLASNLLHGGARPGQPYVFPGERVAKNHQELIDWLKAKNYRHITTNYWIGYRLAFETREQVTFSQYREDMVVRIPAYEELTSERDQNRVFVLVPSQAVLVRSGLQALGYQLRETKVGEYVVIEQLRPISAPGVEIKLSEAQLTVSSRADWAGQLVDENPGTRWGSGEPQHPGMAIEINLERPTELVGITLEHGFWPQDVSRELVIEALVGDGQWCSLIDTRATPALHYVLKDEVEWEIFFPSVVVNKLRIVQLGAHPLFDWSLAEVSLFGSEDAKLRK